MSLGAWLRDAGARLLGSRRESDPFRVMEERLREVRALGVKTGRDCRIFTAAVNFSTEPYLVELGDDVAVGPGVIFATHEGAVWGLRNEYPDLQVFGRIRVGNGTVIGVNSVILPGAEIGAGCIIGAATVVRGRIPDGSLVYGNPARVVGKAGLVRRLLLNHPHRMDTLRLSPDERRARVKAHFGLD